MWADAQCDGRPAECTWHTLLNAVDQVAKITKPRRETRWNLLGCPKLANQSQPLVGRSSPYCEDMSRRYCCLTRFSDCRTCLHCEDIARQSCAMVRRWRIFASCIFQRAACSTFQTCIPVWKYGRHPTCDRGEYARKKERRKKKETTAAEYSGLPITTYGRP